MRSKREMLEIIRKIEEKSKEDNTGFIRLSDYGLESKCEFHLSNIFEMLPEEGEQDEPKED